MQVTVDLLYQEIGKLHISSVALRQEVAGLEQELIRVRVPTPPVPEPSEDDPKDE